MSKILTNPQAPLSTTALTDALRQQTEYLIRQFGKLVSLASTNDSSSPPDSPADDSEPTASQKTSLLPSAAVQTYGIAAETQAFITNVESLTVLTRRLKEAWVFGELETVGASKDVEERTEQTARAIIANLMKKKEEGDGETEEAGMPLASPS